MVKAELRAMWAIDPETTAKLDSKDVVVGVLRPVEGEPPVTTYQVILKFQSEMRVDHVELEQAFDPDTVGNTVANYMRTGLLHCLFDYLVEQDSPDLASLEARVRGETLRDMVLQNPTMPVPPFSPES